jgi:hypothetical protein
VLRIHTKNMKLDDEVSLLLLEGHCCLQKGFSRLESDWAWRVVGHGGYWWRGRAAVFTGMSWRCGCASP